MTGPPVARPRGSLAGVVARLSAIALAAAFTGACLPTAAAAQPWPREAGELFTATFASVYTTTEQADATGEVSPLPAGGRFTGYGAGVYFEYGLSPRWTLQGILNSSYQRFADDNGQKENLSFGDQRVGVRYALHEGEWAASLGGKVGVPWLYSLSDRPLPGFGQYSVQVNGTVGRGGEVAGAEGWSLLKAGLRHHFGGASDQLRTQALLGVNFDRRWGAIVEANGTLALAEGQFRAGPDVSNPNVRSGFSTLKTTASVTYAYSPRSTIQVGLTRELWGLESGHGWGGVIALWYRY